MARLLLLSDLHVVAPGTLCSGVLDTPALLREAVDAILARRDGLQPLDAVLVTGDVSDDGSEASYDCALRELRRLGLPLLAVPGNHDRRAPFRDARATAGSDLSSDARLDWTADIGGTRIIGLDTLVEGQGGGRLEPASLAHLETALKDIGDAPCVVALHHPPLSTGIRFMDGIGLANPEDLADVLVRRKGPLRIVAGHVHGVYHAMLGIHPVSTVPSVASAFMLDRREDAPVGFATGPRGFAVLDTGTGLFAQCPLDHGAGPFPF